MATLQTLLTTAKTDKKVVDIQVASGRVYTGYVTDDGSTNGHDTIVVQQAPPGPAFFPADEPGSLPTAIDGQSWYILRGHIVALSMSPP